MRLNTAAMIDETVKRLNLTSGDETRVLFWYQEAQDRIERLRQDWRFCLSTGTDGAGTAITTVADQFQYDLAADFDHFLKVWNHTDNVTMYPRSLDWKVDRDPDQSETGGPRYYILLGPQGTSGVEAVGLDPIPDTSSESVKYFYYKKLAALTNSASNYSVIPDHSLLMLLVELRGRMDKEEESEQAWAIAMQDTEVKERIRRLSEHNTFDMDGDSNFLIDHSRSLDNF